MSFVSRAASGCATALAAIAASTTLQAQADSVRADSARRMERVLITAIRASDMAPISASQLGRAELRARHFGQDVPMLLTGAVPSVTAHTETGTPWGYSYLRLRGMDQTRINITLDGVPMNDMEDQVLYFANFADLLSSVQSVQVQRGVGTSSAGTASFAGSLNLETRPSARVRPGGEVEVQLGSLGARRLSVGAGTGLVRGFAAQIRGGAVQTGGYREHAGLWGGSVHASAGWFGDRDIVKVNALAGVLADTLSYVGATREELARNWRFNPLDPGERDRFSQQMVSLAHTRAVNPSTSVSTTLYRHSAAGSYDYFALPDQYRYNLQHWWYGLTSALSSTQGDWTWHAGLNANTYERDHRAYQRPATTLHDNTGAKQDASTFVKVLKMHGTVQWFADLQLRSARFHYTPSADADIAARAVSWTFVNPRVGVSSRLASSVNGWFSVGRTAREPARSDMFAGEDDLNAGNDVFIGDLRRVRPERVVDLEAGMEWRREWGRVSGNVYAMEFRNDIARTGAPTASGAIPRRNVGASFRRGLEVEGTWSPGGRVEVGATSTISHNRIRQFVDSTATPPRTLSGVAPMLSPALLASHFVSIAPVPAARLRVEGRYQSRAGLDNTGDPSRTLDSFHVTDLSLQLTRGRTVVTTRLQNALDRRAAGSGYVASDGTPYYFVLPGRAVFLTLRRDF